MVIGIGTDIVNIPRFKNLLLSPSSSSFIRNVYTESEQTAALAQHDKILYFASRFCAKEAIFKTFGIDDLDFTDIEIYSNEINVPEVSLLRKASIIARKKKISHVELSLSNDTDYVIALAMALGESGRKNLT